MLSLNWLIHCIILAPLLVRNWVKKFKLTCPKSKSVKRQASDLCIVLLYPKSLECGTSNTIPQYMCPFIIIVIVLWKIQSLFSHIRRTWKHFVALYIVPFLWCNRQERKIILYLQACLSGCAQPVSDFVFLFEGKIYT